MTFEAWALFCLTEAVLCLSPGTSTLVVISHSLTRGPSAGIRATTGVLAANAIYFVLSASGLVALHALSAETFSIIKWAGAAYLIWLGATMIPRSFKSPISSRSFEPRGGGGGSAFPRLPRAPRRRPPDRGSSRPRQNRARVARPGVRLSVQVVLGSGR
jgi:threonine/homoserine/homoserine lactone efflux protein